MKILFLTSRFPYPPYRGDKLKIYNLIKQISKRHEITLLSFIASRNELQYVPDLKKYCVQIETVYLPAWKSLLSCLLHLFSPEPFQVAYFSSTKMHEKLAALLEGNHFDILHVHLIRMAQYANEKSKNLRVLDLTDAGSLYLQRFFETTNRFLYKLFLKEELKRLVQYEKILESFDKCLVCSEVDRSFLLQHTSEAKIDLLYNGIDVDYFSMNGQRSPTPFQIIYTGNMSYYPNFDGIMYFIKEVFPKVKQEIPNVTLLIVGKDPPRKLHQFLGSSINVTGFVPNIKEYYLRSEIAIAPIRFGAGTLNKVLEPMALGIPVVTSSIGVGGLPLQAGRDVLVANTADEFAASVVRVLNDKQLQQLLSENSKRIVQTLYDWKIIGERLEQIYKEKV